MNAQPSGPQQALPVGKTGLLSVLGCWALAICLSACGGDKGSSEWSDLPNLADADPELERLPSRLRAFHAVCERGHDDSFARALCATGEPPDLRSMVDLLELAGLGDEDSRAFALTGNSTSLVARSVSAINPRLLVFPRVDSDLVAPEEMTALGFVRGEQFVELVSRDLTSGDFTFYLVRFEQNCNYRGSGCSLADLLTEDIEDGWTAYSVYDDRDLAATSFDCLSCHQPNGADTPRILRMQELESPWLHWFPQRFGQRTESDRVLLNQFAETHQYDRRYGGIKISTITNALDEGSGAQLEALIRAEGFGEQPNPFDGQIAAEFKQGASPTWEARFASHVEGTAIAVPYPALDVTDPTKRMAAMQSYTDVVQGIMPRDSLIDIREVFSEDAEAKLSFVPHAPTDGVSVLRQMCSRCHDGRGDQSLPKNRFNILKLEEMSREAKDLAVRRINSEDARRMPPWRSGTLSEQAKAAATAELER